MTEQVRILRGTNMTLVISLQVSYCPEEPGNGASTSGTTAEIHCLVYIFHCGNQNQHLQTHQTHAFPLSFTLP